MIDPNDPSPDERARRLVQLKILIQDIRRDLEVLEAEQDRLREEAQHEVLDQVLEHPEESRVHLTDLRSFGDEAWQEVGNLLADFRERLSQLFHRHRG